jgi:5-(carboxyamino)imidazole ribonucleotide mutase
MSVGASMSTTRSQAGGSSVSGLDALLSIAQMPPGVPVGCMAVNGAKNAALYAAAILALKHDDVRKALEKFRKEQASA